MSEFHAHHQRRYGYCLPQNDVEIVNIRLRAWIRTTTVKARMDQEPNKNAEATNTKMVFDRRSLASKIYERSSLPTGKSVAGPAIIAEYSGTTVVPPEWRAAADRNGNLVLTRKEQRAT